MLGNNTGSTGNVSELPAGTLGNHTDSGHSHGVSHNAQVQNTQALAGGGSTTVSPSAASITIQTGFANIQNTGGGGAHNMQPTFFMNWMVKL